MDGSSIIVAIVFVAAIFYQIWRFYFRKCWKCGDRLRFDSQSDSMGTNISKKLLFPFGLAQEK